MPVIAFTFGAFGDIVSLIQLAMSVRKALSDSTGASMEYQDLVMEVDSFIQIVNAVHRTISLQGPYRLSLSVENAIHVSLTVCSVLIGKIGNKIVDYRESLRKGGGTRMMLDSWRKIGWGLFAKNEIIVLRRRLAEQIEVMNTLLTLAYGHALSQTENDSREQQVMIREMHQCLKEKPNVLGYTWEGAPNPGQEPVIFTDFCGHSIFIPAEFCLSQERFERFQEFYFSDRPGLHFVRSELTSFSQWRPRKRGDSPRIAVALRMDVCVKYAAACPICQKPYPGARVIVGFSAVCPYCQTWYEIGYHWTDDFRATSYDVQREAFMLKKYGDPSSSESAPASTPQMLRRMGKNFFQALFRDSRGDAAALADLGMVRRVLVHPVVPFVVDFDRKEDRELKHEDEDLRCILALHGLRCTQENLEDKSIKVRTSASKASRAWLRLESPPIIRLLTSDLAKLHLKQ